MHALVKQASLDIMEDVRGCVHTARETHRVGSGGAFKQYDQLLLCAFDRRFLRTTRLPPKKGRMRKHTS